MRLGPTSWPEADTQSNYDAAVSSRELGGKRFEFVDLFAGIGGTRAGFELAGGRCVATVERDKFARLTYESNFANDPDHVFFEEITTVGNDAIPPHDVLLAGFPCQPFSLAGVSKKNSLGRAHGFQDETQGTLFYEIQRILSFHKPRAFMLENVKNLQSHNRGETFEVIKAVLEETLGYVISYKIIDASAWVPQHRERILIVGFNPEEVDRSQKFDFDAVEIPKVGPRLQSILHSSQEVEEPPYTQGKRPRVADKYVLTDNLWEYLQKYAEKHRAQGNGFGYGLVGPNQVARTLSARYHKDGSEILVSRRGNRNPRRLTPRECARLMGFSPEFLGEKRNWTIPVSDTQAYRQFGNSVVVPMVKAVADQMVVQFRL